MSDTWYRNPVVLPPYEDGFGNLWAMDGTLTNPASRPRFDDYMDDLIVREFIARYTRSDLHQWHG